MAAFENKTIDEIRDLIVNSIQTKFNAAFRMLSKSFIRVIATVFAGLYVVLYKQIGWVFLQLFPETAHGNEINILGFRVCPLVKWGNLIGVGNPKSGSQWKGNITVLVTTASGVLIAGTQLKSDITGKLYITDDSVPLDGAAVSVPVICTESGTAGSLETGDVLSFVNPLGNVQKTAVVQAVITYPVDDETESEYRARVVRRFRNPPLGGALSDYRKWASDVPGILQAYPYKDTLSPSGVLLYISGVSSLFPDRIPSTELLIAAGRACVYDPETGEASRKPVTAVIDPAFDESYRNVKPVSVTRFDVYVYGISGAPAIDFAEAVKPALENYFLEREPYIRGLSDDNNRTDLISKNNVLSIIDRASGPVKARFDYVLVCAESATVDFYSLGMGELAELHDFFIDGVLI